MDLTLTRVEFRIDGIFSELKDSKFKVLAHVAEHAYDCLPKLPNGIYTCVRGQHTLHSGPIETFEITGVPGHTGILFHIGNWPQSDSDGCLLLGEGLAPSSKGQMVTQSHLAFKEFMKLQAGCNSFILTVN